jgi:alpha-galactosidase
MPPPAPALRHPTAGALEPTRLLVRYRPALRDAADGFGDDTVAEAVLRAGDARAGPFRVTLAPEAGRDCATWRLRVENVGARPARVEAVGLGFLWRSPAGADLRMLRQGYQSWSFAGAVALDEVGTPPFPSGPWLRGFHHGTAAPPADRAGWHESDGVAAVGASPRGATCAAGVLESGRTFGVVYLRRQAGGAVRVEIEQRLERPLDPAEALALEPVRVALGDDANALLEAHAEAQGAHAGARRCAPFQAGWCSWYHFFHGVTEDAFLRNLDALAAARDEIPIELVQLDDGYQRAIGDWLETNEKFPRGLAPLARAVRDAGFDAGIWTAPFCVVPESRIHAAHRDWLLRAADGSELRGLHHGTWTEQGWVHVLDPTHPGVRAHLERTFAALFEMGFHYLKLDFLYTAALHALAHDPRATRAERLRRGLEAIRTGAGARAFLLGCGCPLGPAVGVVDGMRIGPDTAPWWQPLEIQRIPGIEPTVPAGYNALRNTLARAWMHRRLWLDDPDCLLARSKDSKLTRDEVRALAASIAVTGGMAILSDDVPGLAAEERALARETLALAREVDESGQAGTARALDLLSAEVASAVVARAGADWLVALFNASDAPARCAIDLTQIGVGSPSQPEPLLGSPTAASVSAAEIAVELPAHGGALYRLRGAPRLAVFCDFDGTFAVQDVGSTLARRYAGDRRPALWQRLERGELTPWHYNLELLDGLELPEQELEAFLQSVELDPGAHELVAWCERSGVPFRVLSDGFDRNLDRLQEIHGVRFAYDANRLRYDHGAWRIAAGNPDADCPCGTGTCKRGRIEAFRRRHPGVPVVHIGNGRVSDLCGAQAADRVFAKDTLAEELAERGLPFERFETLRDVLAALAASLGSSDER